MKAWTMRMLNYAYRHCYPVYLPLYACYKRVADRQERALLKQWLRPGAVVADVGANVGIYTRFFAHCVGPQGRVHAFEPEPLNYSRLQRQVAAAGNVTAVQAAVGESTGRLALYLSPELNVDHRSYDDGAGRQRIEVPVVRLDDYFAAGTRVDVMKLDVQGHELSVLRGARRLLAENPHMIIVSEFWPYGLSRAGVEPEALLRFAESAGLEWRPVGGRAGGADIRALDPERQEDYCNIVLQRPTSPCSAHCY